MSIEHPSTPQYWDYYTAPDSPILRGLGVTDRQLRRAREQGKLSGIKLAGKVQFSDEHLREFLERSTFRAVR
ncbi:hypothetical protein [Agromyces sp. Root81]|uniref:hypothetical protein n=1 Tax=Agromyces sp. Root81 TaxID=1736601 RepID=UPI000ACCA5C5|nr:hypothetical protein [Agromyces sp. Root81]